MTVKVIGAGLGRTGTASIKMALEQLGLGQCYHMGEVFANLDHAAQWEQAAAGKPDWDTLLKPYGATADYPACSYWQELMEYFPDAKVLLSVRDANVWFDSVHATIFSPAIVEWILQGPMKNFFLECVWHHFGDNIHNRDFMVTYFENRVKEIKQIVPAERLLTFEVKQGWQPLCDFLDLPIPTEPFPRANSREETSDMIKGMISGQEDQSFEENVKQQSNKLFVDKSSTN